jgi:hypothetical protein
MSHIESLSQLNFARHGDNESLEVGRHTMAMFVPWLLAKDCPACKLAKHVESMPLNRGKTGSGAGIAAQRCPFPHNALRF